jgi:hypothetical protein
MPRNKEIQPEVKSAAKRFTVSLTDELVDAIREVAKAEGLSQSAFVAQAVANRVRGWRLRVAIGEMDPFDADEATRLLAESFTPQFWGQMNGV